MLMTATIGKFKVICSFLLPEDEKTAIIYVKVRPDLDMLFARIADQDFSREQHADRSKMTVNSKAYELWRKFKVPLGYGQSPWNWNWQPLLGM